jgi:hypothetical protein
MKKIYLTLSTLLLAFFVLAETSLIPLLPFELPTEKQKVNPPKKQKKRHKSLAAVVTVTKSHTVEGGGSVIPGAQINYSILLAASSDASGVILRDTLNQNLSLVTGSIKATPVTTNDIYMSIGNVGLDVDNPAEGVLANDISPNGKTLNIEAVTDGTTANNGIYTLNTDGTFTYTPAAGFEGNDSFTYTLKNEDNLSANEQGTVTINVSGLIYFVNSAASANGTGTLHSPFKNVSNITETNGKPVFIYAGNYTGALTLTANQKIIGQGAAESIPQILNLTVPPFSFALPETGGTRPAITHSATAIVLSTSNALYGLNISTTGGTTMTGSNVGNLKIRDVNLSNTTGQALQITTGGTLDCIFTSVSASGAEKGISLNNTTGTFEITGTTNTAGSGGTIQNITKRGVEFNTATNITLRNMNFTNANTVAGDAPGDKNNSGVNAALYFSNSNNITLNNIQVNTATGNANARMGINLYNCTNFTLTNSKILRSGLTSGSAGLYAVNTKGIATITNSEIGKSSRGARFTNENSNFTLNISNSKFTDTRTNHDNTNLNPEGQAALLLEGFGSSNIQSTITGSEFLRYATQGIGAYANGTSTVNINVIKSTLNASNPNLPSGEDHGTGTDLASSENGGTVLFNVIETKVTGRQGHQINIFTKDNSKAEGTIQKDTVSYNYVGVSPNNFGSGIRVKHSSNTSGNKVLVNDNHISGVSDNQSFGIDVLTNNRNSPGRIDVTNTNNTVNVGAQSLYAIRMSAADGSQKLCTKITGNDVNAGSAGLASFGSSNYSGSLNEFLFEGNPAGSTNVQRFQNTWNTGNNLLASTGAAPNIVNVEGNGKFTFEATCLLPTNGYNPNMRIATASTTDSASFKDSEILAEKDLTEKPKAKAFIASNKPENDQFMVSALEDDPQIILVNGTGSGFSIPTGKSVTISFSATVALEPTSCDIPNIASVSGSNFTTVQSNIDIANVLIESPSAITSIKNAICNGESIALNTTCTSGVINWYLAGDSDIIETGTSVTVNPTQTTTYEAACMVGGCESDREAVTITVNKLPSVILDESPEICQGATSFTIPFNTSAENPITYSLTGPGVISVTDLSLTSSEITANLINPAIGDSTYSFTLTVKNANGCESEELTGTVSIFTIHPPENPMASSVAVCVSGTVTLTADNCQGTIIWFDASDDLAISGNEPVISENKTYYAKCEEGSCLSNPSAPVNITVIEPLTESPGDVIITWTGLISERWEEACNWSPAWVPDSTNAGVVIPLITQSPPVLDSASLATINKLEIQNGGGIFILGKLNIKSQADTLLNLKGVIYNSGSLLLNSSVASLGISISDSSILLNEGEISIVTKGEGIRIKNPLTVMTLVNVATGKITLDTDSSGIISSDTLPSMIANEGLITYRGKGNAIKASNAWVANTGTLHALSGKGIDLGVESTLLNDYCGQILINEGEFINPGETINVGLIQLPDTYDFVNSGDFLNEGVLKANSVEGVENEHMIITNSCPIFTIGDFNAFTVNGIYTDSLLTIPAGIYSDIDNTFHPSASLAGGTQKLYADVSECSCCGYVVPFNFTNSLPDSVSISKTSVCEGDSVILDAFCSQGTVTWYASDTSSTALGNGRNFSFVPEEGPARAYYVSCESDGCNGSRIVTSDQVTVKPKPAAPTLTAPAQLEVCFPATLEVTAVGCTGSVLWSDSSTVNTLILSVPGIYTVSAKCISDGCASDSSEVLENLTIEDIPTSPVTSNKNVCSGGNVTLSADCASSNSVAKWYTEMAGINEVNPELTNVTLPATYFVACVTTSTLACKSPLIPVKVIVDTPLAFSHNFNYNTSVYGCQNGNTEIVLDTALIGGGPYTLQWQILSGGTFTNLVDGANYQNVNNDTLKISNISLAMNNSLFRVLISNTCGLANSDTTSLKVNQLPEIITHPTGQTVCVGNQTTLSVAADGSGLSYQWQVNTGSSFANLTNNVNYSNVNTPNLTISGIQNSFNNYKYRCVIFNGCQSVNSNEAALVIDPTVTIVGQPINRTVCQGGTVSFTANSVNTTSGSLTYKWQRSTDGGVTYNDVTNGTLYSGVTTKTLTLVNIPASLNQSKFRCVMNGYCQSTGAELIVTPIATVTASPVNAEICEGNNTSFTVKAAGIGLTYRWQVDKGTGFQNILDGDIYDGATSSTLNLFYPTTSVNGYKYRCLVWGASSCDTKADTSGIATLSVGTSSEAHSVVWNSPISTNVGTTQAVSYIFGNNKILQPNGKATYQAGQAILLEPGFEVQAGAVFEAKIKNACQSANNAIGIPEKIKK